MLIPGVRRKKNMAATASTMLLALGSAAPDFRLPDTNAPAGRMVGLDAFTGNKALVVMFICNHCPFVKHVQGGITALARAYRGRGTGRDVRGALDLVLAGKPVPAEASKPSIGCNVKWKAGNEPEYA